MAHLWVRDSANRFIDTPIDGESVALSSAPPFIRPGHPESDAPGAGLGIWLQRTLSAGGEAWVLIAGTALGVAVNGVAVPTGIRVLDNRDEIRCSDGSLFVFSDERLASVEPFPAGDLHARCARCTREFEPSVPAVRCPACGTWYHEHGDFPCWTSVPFCQVCGQATSLAGDTRWTPEEH